MIYYYYYYRYYYYYGSMVRLDARCKITIIIIIINQADVVRQTNVHKAKQF